MGSGSLKLCSPARASLKSVGQSSVRPGLSSVKPEPGCLHIPFPVTLWWVSLPGDFRFAASNMVWPIEARHLSYLWVVDILSRVYMCILLGYISMCIYIHIYIYILCV